MNFAAAGRRAKMQAQQMTPWKKKNNKTSVVFVCQGKNKVSPHGILPWCQGMRHKVVPWDNSGPKKFLLSTFPCKAPSVQHCKKCIF